MFSVVPPLHVPHLFSSQRPRILHTCRSLRPDSSNPKDKIVILRQHPNIYPIPDSFSVSLTFHSPDLHPYPPTLTPPVTLRPTPLPLTPTQDPTGPYPELPDPSFSPRIETKDPGVEDRGGGNKTESKTEEEDDKVTGSRGPTPLPVSGIWGRGFVR